MQYVTSYPGERLNITLSLVGFNFGTVTGSVYANMLVSGEDSRLGPDQHIQAARFDTCNRIEYSVHSNGSYEIVVFTASEIRDYSEDYVSEVMENTNSYVCRDDVPDFLCTALLTAPIFINVTLEECPLGFELTSNESLLACQCSRYLLSHSVTCEISDHIGSVTREGAIWVGIPAQSDMNNETNHVHVAHEYCPYDYCKEDVVPVDLENPDKQCNSNRSGILCGRCKANHSLILGSNRCVESPNNYGIALILFFLKAGIALVLFIKFLDLTVAKGTINGLLLYANVIWGYKSILLKSQRSEYSIITVPIAWMNLDLGIETCFSQEMDAHTKTWLQLLFPIYVWFIAGIIILASHFSTKMTKLIGDNAVSVLATLFLLSYSKLLRSIIVIFASADLVDSNGIHHKVWSFDGNVSYEEPHHVILLMVGLVFLFLWLLYTMSLLLVPCLRRKVISSPFAVSTR